MAKPNEVQIIVHPSHLGRSMGEGAVDTALRMIAWANATAEQRNNGWVDKYGIDLESDAFLMHHFCWCEKEGECPWCTGPNFWYKPTDFRLSWYKYIGRDTATNRELAEGELERIIKDCVPKPAEAFQAVKEIGTERAEQFAQMIEGLCNGKLA